MNVWEELLKILAYSIGGAIASFYVPILLKELNFRKKYLVVGDWHSTWQTNSESDEKWSVEKVQVLPCRGGISLKNSGNNNGYEWEATGSVNKNQYIIGTWHSIKSGSHSAGNFILGVSNQGEYMLGFFLGPNRRGFVNYGVWILARDRKDLEKGKKEITIMCPSLKEIIEKENTA